MIGMSVLVTQVWAGTMTRQQWGAGIEWSSQGELTPVYKYRRTHADACWLLG